MPGKKVSVRKSARKFTRLALRTKKRNVAPPLMRGGYRL